MYGSEKKYTKEIYILLFVISLIPIVGLILYAVYGILCNRIYFMNSFLVVNIWLILILLYAALNINTKKHNSKSLATLGIGFLITYIIGSRYSWPIDAGSCNKVVFYYAFVELNILTFAVALSWLVVLPALCVASMFFTNNKIAPSPEPKKSPAPTRKMMCMHKKKRIVIPKSTSSSELEEYLGYVV